MGAKNQFLLPKSALELFLDYDPKDPNSAVRISERVERIRKKYESKIIHQLIKKKLFAVPRINNHPHYVQVIKSVNESTRFLDMGCGCGWDLRKIIKDGVRIKNAKGIDINPLLIKIGFEAYNDKKIMGNAFEVMDATSTNFKDSYFDIVYSGSVIHALKKRELAIKYINEAYRILKKPDGVFFGRTLGDDEEVENEYLFVTTHANLRKYLVDTGFRTVDVQPIKRVKKHSYEPKYMLKFFSMT